MPLGAQGWALGYRDGELTADDEVMFAICDVICEAKRPVRSPTSATTKPSRARAAARSAANTASPSLFRPSHAAAACRRSPSETQATPPTSRGRGDPLLLGGAQPRTPGRDRLAAAQAGTGGRSG